MSVIAPQLTDQAIICATACQTLAFQAKRRYGEIIISLNWHNNSFWRYITSLEYDFFPKLSRNYGVITI